MCITGEALFIYSGVPINVRNHRVISRYTSNSKQVVQHYIYEMASINGPNYIFITSHLIGFLRKNCTGR